MTTSIESITNRICCLHVLPPDTCGFLYYSVFFFLTTDSVLTTSHTRLMKLKTKYISSIRTTQTSWHFAKRSTRVWGILRADTCCCGYSVVYLQRCPGGTCSVLSVWAGGKLVKQERDIMNYPYWQVNVYRCRRHQQHHLPHPLHQQWHW